MSAPILTAEQRVVLYEEASCDLENAGSLVMAQEGGTSRERVDEIIRTIRDAISVLDLIGWYLVDEPLAEFERGTVMEDREALQRFASRVREDRMEALDQATPDYLYARHGVEAADAALKAVA